MDKQAIERAKQILQQNIYAVVATATTDGVPWNTPVFVVFDEDLNFYWASAVKSQHSQNIGKNPHVFLSIFNSQVPWGKGEGVYIQATAEALEDPEEITHACELRYRREQKANQSPSDFTGALPRRMYRAAAEHIWVNSDATQRGYFVDGRVPVDLAALQAALAAK